MLKQRIVAWTSVVAAALTGGLLWANSPKAPADWQGRVYPPSYKEAIFPPWSGGKNNSATNKGFQFTVPEVDDMPDFHGDPFHAKLVLYIGGNYYFAVGPLVRAFEKSHPSLNGKIFAETLPPGILLRQIKAHGRITVGNMTFSAKPDVYAAGLLKVKALIAKGILSGPAISYATNNLTIMIPKKNPGHIESLRDLGRPGVRLSMPNPAWEGVARQIKLSLVKAGGTKLEKMVYDTKVRNGQTILTHIHHRQTPLYLMQGLAEAGVTWKSEAIFQEQAGHPIANVPIPAKYNTTAIYAGAVVRHARHQRAARQWLRFLKTPTAQAIFARYGFKPVAANVTRLKNRQARLSDSGGTVIFADAVTTAPPAAGTPTARKMFTPPPESAMPGGKLGQVIKQGENIFDNTQGYASKYVGDGLNCENCHLQAGRQAYSAPMWAAYVAYPSYQAKAGQVVTFAKRIQECFEFSMNGKAPPATGKVMTALISYSAWLAKGAAVGMDLAGRGYQKLPLPALKPDAARGKAVFTVNCIACHGAQGQGLKVNGKYQFPPLWGPHSYNFGAGMAKIKMAAAFIKKNMPLNKPGSLTDQQAWDVAAYVDSHTRPPDPRKIEGK
jgi:cytochrome c/ABC-type molybdate transport system substrate-binding protein